ncbi:MAG TPA: gliding motility protein GldL [Bacteroidales bacterium]|nr:gliding motility protein GldL [Bacteroidales bacterium]HPS63238.1 gliding motility protein GldL [Bacteroidales bacterium]
MALLDFVKTKGYKNFMSKLYGWGAAVVIIGALFKINHYTGADAMLIIGLGTESIIFFFSAFEPPHVEPDWSLVYPQLAGIYHGDEVDASSAFSTKDTVTQELDKMLEKAKIGPELIENLGKGLTNLSATTAQLSNVANATVANDKYITVMKTATESAQVLNDSYRKTAQTMEQSVQASEEQLVHIKSTAKSAANLSTIFAQVSESLKEDVNASKGFSASMANATTSANKFIEKYTESANLLSQTAETLNTSANSGAAYNKELQRISSNLSALNALYELHLQSSNKQMESTNSFNAVMNKFATNLNETMANTDKFKTEVENLTKNIASLNKVYGNMLSAMNIGGK